MNEDFYINLIYKKLSEEITPPEQEQLAAWIAESETNQQIAKDVEMVWNVSGDLDPPQTQLDIDLDKEFAALEERIQKEEQALSQIVKKRTLQKFEADKGSGAIVKPINATVEKKKGVNPRALFSIAASIALVLFSSALLWNYFGPNSASSAKWVEVQSNENSQVIKLADNSVVNLNANSWLKYPKTFDDKNRVVELKGEAFFEVNHNPANPFIVETIGEKITVLGTSFNVRAYEAEAGVVVQVETGKVQLKPKNATEKVILEAGNQGSYVRSKQQLKKINKGSVNAFAWHSKRLQFVETPIEQVVADLEGFYRVNVEVKNSELNKCLFTSDFKDANINTILETISGVLGVDVKKMNEQYYILQGGNCQ